jgi:hypothetical protein
MGRQIKTHETVYFYLPAHIYILIKIGGRQWKI